MNIRSARAGRRDESGPTDALERGCSVFFLPVSLALDMPRICRGGAACAVSAVALSPCVRLTIMSKGMGKAVAVRSSAIRHARMAARARSLRHGHICTMRVNRTRGSPPDSPCEISTHTSAV